MLTFVWLSLSSLVSYHIYTVHLFRTIINPFNLQSSSLALWGLNIHSATGISILNSGFPTSQTHFALVLVRLPCLFMGQLGSSASVEKSGTSVYICNTSAREWGQVDLWSAVDSQPSQIQELTFTENLTSNIKVERLGKAQQPSLSSMCPQTRTSWHTDTHQQADTPPPQIGTRTYTQVMKTLESFTTRVLMNSVRGYPNSVFLNPTQYTVPSIQLNHPVEAWVHSLSFFGSFHLSPVLNDVLQHGRVTWTERFCLASLLS